MAEPKDMIVPMLREIRAEIRDVKTEMKEGFAGVNKRLDSIDDVQRLCLEKLNAKRKTVEKHSQRVCEYGAGLDL